MLFLAQAELDRGLSRGGHAQDPHLRLVRLLLDEQRPRHQEGLSISASIGSSHAGLPKRNLIAQAGRSK